MESLLQFSIIFMIGSFVFGTLRFLTSLVRHWLLCGLSDFRRRRHRRAEHL